MHEITVIVNFYVQGSITHEATADTFENMITVVTNLIREEIDAEDFLINVKCPMDRK